MKTTLAIRANTFLKKIFKYGYAGGICRYLHFMKLFNDLKLPNDSKVLDAGCGKGEIAYTLARNFRQFRVVGYDKKRSPYWDLFSGSNLQFDVRDLQTGQLGKSEFDMIYSIDVLEHIQNNRFVLSSLAQALKPGGILIILMPSLHDSKLLFGRRFYKSFEDWAASEHIGQRYTLTELCSLIRDMDFEILEARYSFGFFGQLASDIERSLAAIIGPITKCFIPLYFILCYLDVISRSSDGNGLCVVAQKNHVT
jgi:SAM-dependent methyltransferase